MEKKIHQTTYYRTVPVSEKPKEPGNYVLIHKSGAIGTMKFDGRVWWNMVESVTHYLQPIALPDAERLRDALEACFNLCEHLRDKILTAHIYEKDPVTGVNETTEVMRIAREALFQTGDGWIEIKEGCEMPDYDELVLWHPIDGNQFTAMLDKDGNDWLAHCTHWKRLGNNPDIDMSSPEVKKIEAAYDEYISGAMADGWIRSEQNPKKEGEYLVSAAKGVTTLYWMPDTGWYSALFEEVIDTVTHWRPLPPQPINK